MSKATESPAEIPGVRLLSACDDEHGHYATVQIDDNQVNADQVIELAIGIAGLTLEDAAVTIITMAAGVRLINVRSKGLPLLDMDTPPTPPRQTIA